MIGAYSPSIYERGSNKKLVECACNHLSLSDNFVIPVGYRQLAEQYEFAAKECEEIYK